MDSSKPLSDMTDAKLRDKMASLSTSHVPLRQPEHSRGFSVLELLVVIGILTVIAAILFPVFSSARRKAHQSACTSNLRQLSAALKMYLQDNDGVFPPFNGYVSWAQMLKPLTREGYVFRCPGCVVPSGSEGGQGPWGYAFNSYLSLKETAKDGDARSDTDIPFPATTVVFCEASYYRKNASAGGVTVTTSAFQPETEGTGYSRDEPYPHDVTYFGGPGGVRHQGGSNYGFVDGHVRWHKPEHVWSATRGNDGQHPSFGLAPK